MGEIIAIAVLSGMNVFQVIIILRLVDRLMSRNYYDFKVTEQLEPKTKEQPKVPEESDFEDMGYLSGI